MRILLINDYGTPTGGAELVVLGLRQRLRERGHDARLFSSSARPSSAASIGDYECLGTTSRWRTLLQSANPWAFWTLRRVLTVFGPDVVHVRIFLTQLSPAILPLLRHVPAVLQVAWYRPVCPVGTKTLPDGRPCQEPWGAACYRNGCLPLRDWGPLMLQMKWWWHYREVFDVVVAQSQAVKKQLEADGISPVEVMPHGVPDQPMRSPLTPPPTVAFAGRLVPEKGVEVLLRAFARVVTYLPEAQLLMVGDGPERLRLERVAAELQVASRITWTGQLPRAESQRLLVPAWLQVVPSLWAEPFGLVAAEAMMRGTAVIASQTGGLGEIVQHGDTGLHVPPGDVEALARAVRRLLEDRDLAERMGRAGRAVALARYSESAAIDKIEQLYHYIRLKGGSRVGRQTERETC
jgi:glycosyltransferase involved in cell wall biosynthesis